MKTYVIQREGDEIGVFTKRQLKQGIRSGEVKPSDEMRQTGTREWHPVGSVSKLFEDLKETGTPPKRTNRSFFCDQSGFSRSNKF